MENIIRKDGPTIGIQHAMDKTVQFYSKKLDREQNMQNSNSNNGTMAFGSNQQGIPGKTHFFASRIVLSLNMKIIL